MINTIPLLITTMHLILGWGLGRLINWLSEGTIETSTITICYFLIVIHKYTFKYYNLSYLLFNNPKEALEMAKKAKEFVSGDKNGKQK